MSDVSQSIVIELPRKTVIAHLEKCLGAPGAASGSATLTLRAPIAGLGDTGLQREADVSYVVRRDPLSHDRTHEAMAIRWEPKGGGPYPTMWGLLRFIEAGERTTKLELEGHYTPPLGSVGKIFDAALGKHIANATVAALLAQLREEVLAEAPSN